MRGKVNVERSCQAFVVEFADCRHAKTAAKELHGLNTEGAVLLTSLYRKPSKSTTSSDGQEINMDSAMILNHLSLVHQIPCSTDEDSSPNHTSPGSYKPLDSSYEFTPPLMASFSGARGVSHGGMYDTPSSMNSSSPSGTGSGLLTPHTPLRRFVDPDQPDPAYSTPTRRRTLADLADSTNITPTEYAIRSVQRQTAKYENLNTHLLASPSKKAQGDLFYYIHGGSPSTRNKIGSAPVSPERRSTMSPSTGRLPSFNPLKHSQSLTLADWRKTTGQIKGQGSLKYVQEVPPNFRFTLENLERGEL